MVFRHEGHIGVGSISKLIHSVAAIAANMHNSQVIDDLPHGKEVWVSGDSAYTVQ